MRSNSIYSLFYSSALIESLFERDYLIFFIVLEPVTLWCFRAIHLVTRFSFKMLSYGGFTLLGLKVDILVIVLFKVIVF